MSSETRSTTSNNQHRQHQRLTVLVSGRVQGVGYRAFVQQKAKDLALAGSAENLSDGRVEVIAEGPREALERLLHFLALGSLHAQALVGEAQWSESSGLRGFYVV
jgi:acylphosphatase